MYCHAAYVGGMLKHVDFVASNVHGIDVSVYLAGSRVTDWYAFGPTIGAALNVTLVSYNGTCYIGVNEDTGAIPDADAMLECLRDGFREVIDLRHDVSVTSSRGLEMNRRRRAAD